MKRREFIGLLGGLAFGWPIGATAQQPSRARLIGALLTGADPQTRDAFIRELEKLGWIEGRNIHIEARVHAGDPDRMHAYTTELIKLSPDVILAATSVEAIQLAKVLWIASLIPVATSLDVLALSLRWVESGFKASKR
jgi:putative ABC transport system substrate-binding protein